MLVTFNKLQKQDILANKCKLFSKGSLYKKYN